MENKKPINVFNGLKSKMNMDTQNQTKPKSNLITIQSYQNSQNISKPFVKPISKII
ncbi:hypothetical protein [Flavobacterium sp. ov086]|uniref:hypothetical protein n=1 Tax=Flavobacterium sp. ov086 TaxID=1761785 RepID=UPI000B69DDF9|nr:hypothetical protein [Flavobacterium sp. ov086]SNR33183.1 hypothetical protein SAMN04487979_10391 [Flavobacterium sp. ov086]